MQRQHVSSSNLDSIGYDSENSILEIAFKGGGIYQYFDVPDSVYRGIMNVDSHGKYFHRFIRNVYDFEKVG